MRRSPWMFAALGAASALGAAAAAIAVAPHACESSPFSASVLALISTGGLIVFVAAAITLIALSRVDDSRRLRIRHHVGALAIAAIGALFFAGLAVAAVLAGEPYCG